MFHKDSIAVQRSTDIQKMALGQVSSNPVGLVYRRQSPSKKES